MRTLPAVLLGIVWGVLVWFHRTGELSNDQVAEITLGILILLGAVYGMRWLSNRRRRPIIVVDMSSSANRARSPYVHIRRRSYGRLQKSAHRAAMWAEITGD